MSFDTTYRQGRERIGQLHHRLTFLTPVRSRTAHGGQAVQWVEWKKTRGMVENLSGRPGGDEPTISDRRTAVNTKRFTVRSGSIPGVNETMVVQLDGESFDIQRIDTVQDGPRGMYKEITATRRDTTVNAVEFLSNGMYLDYAQTFPNVTGTDIVVTAGTLPDPAETSAAQIHQLLDVFRGPLHLTYGEAGNNGFTIDANTNTITVNAKLRGENVLVRQYSIVSS